MAANDKKTTIVIKKITIAAAGGHGGSWKVAFADFMTAMMAFFLVMWLVNQSEEVKKNVSEYFSTPSIIEYNFSNYGVELTLEKLFLDLMNEPLKAVEDFITPVDKKPNVLDMGLKKIQMAFLEEKVGEYAEDMNVSEDEITFDIADEYLFKRGTSDPAPRFVDIMERVRGIVEGVKDANIYINSELPYRNGNPQNYRNIADARLDLVSNKVEQGMKNEGVDVFGKITVEKITAAEGKRDSRGYMRFRIQMKDKPKSKTADGRDEPHRTSASAAGAAGDSAEDKVYDDFVNKLTKKVEDHAKQDRK
jgi:chemotaxis protein MotB